MDQLKGWSARQEFIAMFLVLTMVSKGSACEAPLSPECFKTTSVSSEYICEWSVSSALSNATYDLCFMAPATADLPSYIECKGNVKNRIVLLAEGLIKKRPVYIWVVAHVGNSSCKSPNTSVVLLDRVKYAAPANISLSWSYNNLTLSWMAAEDKPAVVDIRFRRLEDAIKSWENRSIETNAKKDALLKNQIGLSLHLQRHAAYQVQVRQKRHAKNSLWSDWSPVEIVPVEIEHPPEVNLTYKEHDNGTRSLKLTWKAPPYLASVRGVTYNLTNSQSSHGCPCPKKKKREKKRGHVNISNTEYSSYVTNSAVNISIIAINSVGSSPPTYVYVPAKPIKHSKTCSLPNKEVPSKNCIEWYEFVDEKARPDKVNILRGRKNYNDIIKKMKDYIRYYYFEHKCDRGIPKTIEMCLYYRKEGAPRIKPQDFIAINETHNSAVLSWKPIPIEDQQGFLRYYVLCSTKTNKRDEAYKEVCHNISASHTEYLLDKLIPGAIYNISLAGATAAGSGPKAIAIININTVPEKPVNVWMSLGLLLVFFFTTIMCTIIIKRMKNKIFPPVPRPVIHDNPTNRLRNQEMSEIKEEVHEFTLQQPELHVKSLQTLDLEGTTLLRDVCETDESEEELVDERILGDSSTPEGPCDEPLSPGYKGQALRHSGGTEMTDFGQGDSEVAMLMYRNGLVFDMKADSTEDVGTPKLVTCRLPL